jgi:hypothetical protein
MGCDREEPLYRVPMPDRPGERVLCPSHFPEELRQSGKNPESNQHEIAGPEAFEPGNGEGEGSSLDMLAKDQPMPANGPTHRNGENVSDVPTERELRRQWVEWRLAFLTDDLLNPAIIHGLEDGELLDRLQEAERELKIARMVLSLELTTDSEYHA